MYDPAGKNNPSPPANLISLFRDLSPGCQERGKTDPEAFCIRTEEIFYLSVLFKDREKTVHGHGYAVFSNGEKVRFTIEGNGDASVRERCIQAGQQIAAQFRADLEQGKINLQGEFIPDR